LENDRLEIEINLVVALLLLHLCNLLQEAAAHQKLSCEIITVLTHFFLLASGKLKCVFLFSAYIVSRMVSFFYRMTKILRFDCFL